MSFKIANWTCISSALNQGQQSVTVYPDASPTTQGAPNIFIYGDTLDSVATIFNNNYFYPQQANLKVGDWIIGNGSDASFSARVTASSISTVTIASTGLTSSIGTSNILDGAVTSAKLGPNLAHYQVTTVTATQFKAMYASPLLLVAAPGASNLANIVEQMVISLNFNTTPYAAGGLVALQYDSTANGLGTLATLEQAASDFYASANTMYRFLPSSAVAAYTTVANKALYLSNKTAAFTNGLSDMQVHIWYKTISLT